jgi:hypothetical protein
MDNPRLQLTRLLDLPGLPALQVSPGPLSQVPARGLLVIAAPFAATQPMLILAARLALHGPLRVIDAGNRFNAYRVALTIRRLTAGDPAPWLRRIAIARAFTCHQVAALLEQTPTQPAVPVLVIDLLDTFYDESAPLPERRRLLRTCLSHLRALSCPAPVVASLRPPQPGQPDLGGFIETIHRAADLFLTAAPDPVQPAQPRLPLF